MLSSNDGGGGRAAGIAAARPRGTSSFRPAGRWAPPIVVGLLALGVLATATVGGERAEGSVPRDASSVSLPDISASCGTDNPFFAATVFGDTGKANSTDPSVVAFQDSLDETADQRITLATQGQVGTVFGLAAHPATGTLFASAYFRSDSSFGPLGPGGIYRIDLSSGAVENWTAIEAGPDRHEGTTASADRWVGISSLGDLALSDDGSTLFVANLFSGRIFRLSTADASELGRFRHGGSNERWGPSSRLFALAFHQGRLFHAVAQSSSSAETNGPLIHVYSSLPDGSDMRAEALQNGAGAPGLFLDPTWVPWTDTPGARQPAAVGLDFDAMGRMVLGVRNRSADMAEEGWPPGLLASAASGGMVMWLDPQGPDWSVSGTAYSGGRATTLAGSVAAFPGLDLTVASGYGGSIDLVGITRYDVAAWFAGPGLSVERNERIDEHATAGLRPNPEGGVEPLCARAALDPVLAQTATVGAVGTRAASATAAGTLIAGTATAQASVVAATATAAAATRAALPSNPAGTATAAVGNLATINGSCGTDRPYFVVTCFARDSDLLILANEPAIVAFDGSRKIALASITDVGATYGLAHDLSRDQLYAGAYNKRGAPFGPAGPGGIYRIDLTTGAVGLWTSVPAGHDPHSGFADFDAGAAPWVGRLSLGDIEINDTFSTLFAMNLHDGHIYRYSVPDGGYLGRFPAPLTETGGHPFGLGFRAGWLYVGVVTDNGPTAHVYRSRADGTETEEVLQFSLAYGHQPPWSPWTPIGEDIFQSYQSQPMLSDIEFGPTGDLLLGLRDRTGDSQVSLGTGDLLIARRGPTGWTVQTSPEFYKDDNIHIEPLWGGLALAPSRDVTVATVLDPIVINSGGIGWFDNQSGLMIDEMTIYHTTGNSPTFNKAAGLGDLEGLCPNPDVPTPVPSPSRTPSLTPTPSPTRTVTPSPTPTPTPTPTRTPAPIYIPVLLDERCEDRTRHADIVLVIDASSSMLRLTAQGRPKLVAVQDAARLFFAQMDFAPNAEGALDQVAVAAFHNAAWTAQALTSQRAQLDLAIERLPDQVAQGTRLDLAIEQGAVALADPARMPANKPVLVLLTDGVPNRVPTPQTGGTEIDTVLAAAARAKAAGIEIYTIGVGQENATDPADRINTRLLEQVASHPDMFFQTPNAEDLAAIYPEIAVTIACPRGRHDWSRPWP